MPDERIVELIEMLVEDEGSSLTIMCKNPDFVGPNRIIDVCDHWTEWQAARFEGETLEDALEAALTSKESGENREKLKLMYAGLVESPGEASGEPDWHKDVVIGWRKQADAITPGEYWVRWTSPGGLYYWLHPVDGRWVGEPEQITMPTWPTSQAAYLAASQAERPNVDQ